MKTVKPNSEKGGCLFPFLILLLVSIHFTSRPTEPNRTRYIDPSAQTTTGALGQFEIQDTVITYPTTTHFCPLLGQTRIWKY